MTHVTIVNQFKIKKCLIYTFTPFLYVLFEKTDALLNYVKMTLFEQVKGQLRNEANNTDLQNYKHGKLIH